MKIVDRTTFLAMPAGTVFTKYEPRIFGEIYIKGETCGASDRPDFTYQALDELWVPDFHGPEHAFERLDRGESVPLDYDCMGRDGLWDEDQLFAVWEPADVLALIERLQRALASSSAHSEDPVST